MKRISFYILKTFAFISRMFSSCLYMVLIVKAHKIAGVHFLGKPEYIHTDAMLDPSGSLTISDNVVISTKVIILTHDWSGLKRTKLLDRGGDLQAFKPVLINENSFIGAGVIILPGSTVGKNCIIGAGAVVKGNVEDYSIVVGNPCKKIGDTRL